MTEHSDRRVSARRSDRCARGPSSPSFARGGALKAAADRFQALIEEAAAAYVAHAAAKHRETLASAWLSMACAEAVKARQVG